MVRLTRAGWVAIVGGIAAIIFGRVVASREFSVAGVAILALVVATVIYVLAVAPRLSVKRDVTPLILSSGAPARIDLKVVNMSGRTVPSLRLYDPVTSTRGAALLTSPLGGGSATVAAYRLPTTRRGRITVGPLVAEFFDTFGLVSRTWQAAGTSDVLVLPRVDKIAPPPLATGRDPHSGAVNRNTLGRLSGDFYALREYHPGDDLRRVHWAASARHDDLLIRQDEVPWQGRTTIVLDTRTSAFNFESFEGAVSAAASVASAAVKRGDVVRLVTTNHADSDYGTGATHLHGVLRDLATIEVNAEGDLRATIASLQGASNAGSLVAIVGDIPAREFGHVALLRRAFDSITVAWFARSDDSVTSAGSSPLGGVTVVPVDAKKGFPAAWSATFGAAPGARSATFGAAPGARSAGRAAS